MTKDAQNALRRIIEQYSKVRWFFVRLDSRAAVRERERRREKETDPDEFILFLTFFIPPALGRA